MSRLSKNILYNLTGQTLLMVLGFVAVRYVFRRLGADALGIIYFSYTLNTLLTAVLAMGICETTVREVSAHYRSAPLYIKELINSASLFYWGIYLACSIALYFGSSVLVAKWIHLKTLDQGTAVGVLRVLAISSFLALPRSFYASILRGLERMEFNNFIDVATSALQQFGTIFILIGGGALKVVVFWIAFCYGLSTFAYVVISASFFSWGALLPGFSSTVVRRNLRYASHMAVISLLAVVQTQADKAVLSKLLPIGVFGFYSLAYSGISRGTLITSSTFQAAFPRLSSLFQSGDRAGLLAQYRKLHDLVCFSCLPILAVFPFAARPVFTYLLNSEAAHLLLWPLTFLSLGFYMNGTLSIPYAFSLAVGKPEITARSNLYATLLVLPTTVMLVYFYGLNGAGLSWVSYHIFVYAYAVPRICSECLGAPASGWYLHTLEALALGVISYGTAYCLLEYLGARSILALLVGFGGATLVFGSLAYLIICDELRSAIKQACLRPLRDSNAASI
jgi:O-antigen/teichoic acid export membrane protein